MKLRKGLLRSYIFRSRPVSKCEKFLSQFRNDLWYAVIEESLNVLDSAILAIFFVEAVLYWIDDFR